MSSRGVIGIAVLWIIGALSAVALSALSVAKWQLARGEYEIQDLRANYLAHAAALLAYSSNFEFSERTHEFATGKVRVERKAGDQKDMVRLKCAIDCGIVHTVLVWFERSRFSAIAQGRQRSGRRHRLSAA